MIDSNLTVLLAEDDEGHASLIRRNLERTGICEPIIHFGGGKEVLDFLFKNGPGPHRYPNSSYMLILDIRMPRVDGVEVLGKIKADPELKKMPVIMLTTTDDPDEIEKCYSLGCNSYITKSHDYTQFVNSIKHIGSIISFLKVPKLRNGVASKVGSHTGYQ